MRLTMNRARAVIFATPVLSTLVLAALGAFAPIPQAHAAETAGTQPAAHATPQWLRDGVIYEVFPRAFSASGDFKGVTAQLDRLKALGVTIVWMMPIHPVGKLKSKGTLGSPYAVRDYDAINTAYGQPEDLKKLVAAAHQRGMKVFIDLVANHTAWDSVLISRHPDWYVHDATGHIIPPNPDWVDVADLDYSKPGLRQYMSGMLVRWLRDFDIDGFRCDYASGVPTDFWESIRPDLERAKPGVVMLAEADDPALLNSAFDIDYAWDFYHVVSDAISGIASASEVRAVWERAELRYPRGALRLRFSDNHDQLRATAQFGLPAALAASALMFTLDGVPLIYNGMEVGDTTESTAPSLFERRPIAWEMVERKPQVTSYYQSLAALRGAHPAFTQGSVQWLGNDEERRVLSFERTGAGESLVVVVNLSNQSFMGRVAAPSADYREITPQAPTTTPATQFPAVALAPWGFRVFRRALP